jgi:putative ABC transport system permease protein
MGFINVRSRREEIGILRAIGVTARRIFMLFFWKHVSIGLLGGIFGLLLGSAAAILLAGQEQGIPPGSVGSLYFWTGLAALAVIGSSMLAVIAGWIPAVIASGQDPAEVLRGE